jgi:hypothetical protein
MAVRKGVTLYPEKLPPYMPVLNKYRNGPIAYRVLHWIALKGFSTRNDIVLAIGLDISTQEARKNSRKRIARACEILEIKENFIEQTAVELWKNKKFYLIRLTPAGKKYCKKSYGWKLRSSDWDELLKRHNGKQNEKHSAAVLSFTYHARLRGWKAEVMPYDLDTLSLPDVMISKGNEKLFVEIETQGNRAKNKLRKWQKQAGIQGRPVVCMLTAQAARNVADSFHEMGFMEYDVTSIEYLQKTAYDDQDNRLWQISTEDRSYGTR